MMPLSLQPRRFRWNRQRTESIQTTVNFVRMLVGLTVAACCCACEWAGDEEAVPPQNLYNLKIVPFDKLSERYVSRQGDAALASKA